ncbi:MAG TPA: signal peptidase I [Mycobacteriales bacterium]|nr:signal peptidase I [Mycobacteriales bacterium]
MFRTVALVLAAMYGLTVVGMAVAVRTGHVRCLRVLTGSMNPVIAPGSLVVGTPVAAADLRVGEVIMFQPPRPYATPNGDPIVHRVVDVVAHGNQLALRTRGDANPVDDPWTIDATHARLYRVAFHSVPAGFLVGAVRRWGKAELAVVLVIPLWLMAMTRVLGTQTAALDISRNAARA